MQDILLIIIIYLEQWDFCKRKLSKDNNGTKNCLVLKQLVAIRGGQYRSIFEPFVNSLSAKSILAGEKLVATYSIST